MAACMETDSLLIAVFIVLYHNLLQVTHHLQYPPGTELSRLYSYSLRAEEESSRISSVCSKSIHIKIILLSLIC